MSARSAAVTLAFIAMSCSSGGSTLTPAPSPSATELTAAEAAKPDVEITYPPQGRDPIATGDVLVALTVRSFSIVDRIGEDAKEGEGHLVYYLDVDDIPTKEGRSAVAEGPGRAAASTMTSHTWEDVSPGPHTLSVQLVNNDDTPLTPPVIDEIEVVVGR
jgi:hypothetical protein